MDARMTDAILILADMGEAGRATLMATQAAAFDSADNADTSSSRLDLPAKRGC